MLITLKKILSLATDGASCHILVFSNQVHIMIDCGISHSFDFTAYYKHQEEISKVCMVLISHSALQYSGAFPFLIEQFQMDPSIFYCTQPIMRYAPLNVHEQILNTKVKGYSKKIFNKIYSNYEGITLVKPHQRQTKEVGVKGQQVLPQLIGKKIISFCCYNAGGSIGSICWRINVGLISIVYLVQYTNYSLYHVNGCDLEGIRALPTHILITDCYSDISNSSLQRQNLYYQLKKVILSFYTSVGLDAQKPRALNQQTDRKLLVTCYPSQLLVQVMLTVRKIIAELQEVNNRQKIMVIHLSSRYIQLVKSQVQYLSSQFKELISDSYEYFIHSKNLLYRLNIASACSLNGILNRSASSPNVTVYHVGVPIDSNLTQHTLNEGFKNLQGLKMFQEKMEDQIQQPKKQFTPIKQQEKIDEEQSQDDEREEPGTMEKNLSQKEIALNEALHKDQEPLVGKYLSQIGGFPRFVFLSREEDHQFDDYGLRLNRQRQSRSIVKTIQDYDPKMEPAIELKHKKSKIEVMNIDFSLPELTSPFSYEGLSVSGTQHHKTNLFSSIEVIRILKPHSVLFVNSGFFDYNIRMQRYDPPLRTMGISVFDLCDPNLRGIWHTKQSNQLLEYKINYLSLNNTQKLHKVKGTIKNSGSSLHIHLECSEDMEILEFRMDLFFKKMKNTFNCFFTGHGINIQGVQLYRKGKEIILEGHYCEQYFRVRQMLHQFLHLH